MKKSLKTITLYETSDGKEFTSFDEAQKREDYLRRLSKYHKFIVLSKRSQKHLDFTKITKYLAKDEGSLLKYINECVDQLPYIKIQDRLYSSYQIIDVSNKYKNENVEDQIDELLEFSEDRLILDLYHCSERSLIINQSGCFVGSL